ncbi:MAG: hypothetical protein KGL39_48355 [Patescibacteria group bacterium]|nr:hypothetical protein [Patescibacteria group bacterium]
METEEEGDAVAVEPDVTAAEQKGPRKFQPGQSGNPAGRPKGARSKLGETFLEALHQDFASGGVEAIVRVREADPAAYVRVIASILPRELKIETTSDLTDEQLDARIRQLAAALEIGIGGPSSGAPAQGEQEPFGEVSTLH